ncbi:transposable element Tcb2 transposase [Trichonephila clavipes]|nr:transposable element Tcb2 transposase [Trichonephila clavipes]
MLEAETIQRMEWPTCSPDLNPIEHVWDILGRHIAARPRPPATVRDLEIALLEEWNSIPQSLIDNLMANRTSHFLREECRLVLSCGKIITDESRAGRLVLIPLCRVSSVWVYGGALMDTPVSLTTRNNSPCMSSFDVNTTFLTDTCHGTQLEFYDKY